MALQASVTPCLPFPIFRSSFVIRHSSFVIRHSSFVIRTFPPRHSPHPAAHSRVHRTADNSIDWQALREDFPILDQQVHGHPLIYFDNAATTHKPKSVLDALRHYYERDNANVHRGLHELSSRATEAYEGARSRVAEYIGAADAGEIVFTRGTTESINLVAHAWGGKFLRSGDVILLTEMEHHSNLVPWQLLAQRAGARLRFVPVLDDGTLALDQLDELLTPEVKLFAFTHVSNSLGTINPAADFCRKARNVGAVTLVDAAQSAGHMPVDVQEIGCDFLAFSGHKMGGPTGIGALYGRAEILESLPPWHGGGEMIVSVSLEKSSYKKPPHRFEAGTPNIAGAIGLAAAIDYLEGIGRAAIFEHDSRLARYALDRFAELPGMRVLGPAGERGAIVGFVMDAAHPHDLTTFADQRGLALRGGHHCNQPLMRRFGLPGTTRASFYFYNTTAEIDRMIDILRDATRFFGPK
ncbi:MAG: cysteine desulfurase [Verrucomicrobia bacterium]|nr:MAG: cysteine desulfurase [Verrucomicrobiota bacterium]